MFVALDLPRAGARASWRRGATRWSTGARDLRPVAPEALHVTLVFLGWQDEAAADGDRRGGVRRGAGGAAPLLRAARVRPLPPRDPRLFALDLDDEDGRASALQAARLGRARGGRLVPAGEAARSGRTSRSRA